MAGKEDAREFMAGIFDQGYLDNAEADLENAETTIEQDKAEVTPVDVTSDNWDGTLSFTLQKEDGNWLIVGADAEG